MDAILLAGGFGTRLRPLTYTRPKPLLPVAGRPMLEWVLDRLPPEVDRVMVTVNWHADALAAYCARREGSQEVIVVPESKPLGTAGAVKNCEAHLGSEAFFVLNADIVSEMDLTAQVRQHEATGAVGTIAAKEVEPSQVVNFGVIDPDGPPRGTGAVRIRGFVEKPNEPALAPSLLINAGAYLLDRSVLDLIPTGDLVSMEKDIFPRLIPDGFYAVPFEGAWIDVGDAERMRAATAHLDPTFVGGEDTQIDGDAQVVDSVLGARCQVAHGARLRRCVVGDDVRIGPGVDLRDCIVGDDETVAGSHQGQRIWSQPVPPGYPAAQVGNTL